jgi:hypothetical protein
MFVVFFAHGTLMGPTRLSIWNKNKKYSRAETEDKNTVRNLEIY